MYAKLACADFFNMTDTAVLTIQNAIHIGGETISRMQMESLIANATKPLFFDGCDFEGADLSRLAMSGFIFKGCTLMETSLYAANLSHSTWLSCRGRQANFEAADLSDSQFQRSDLNNTNWRRARLSSTSFKGCKLTGANFEEVSFLGLTFEDTLLIGADLRNMSFRKAKLQQLDFSDADLSGCDFSNAVFLGGSLRNANLKLTRFDGADLREADLGGLMLHDAKLFRGATISRHQATVLLGELGLMVA